MKQYLTLILLILISKNVFCNAPILILNATWGKNKKQNEIKYVDTGGGLLIPTSFGIDFNQNIYINNPADYNIRKYDSKGQFIQDIPNKTQKNWDIQKIILLKNNNIFIYTYYGPSGNAFYLIDQQGSIIKEEIAKKKENSKYFRNYVMKGNEIYYSIAENKQKKLNLINLKKNDINNTENRTNTILNTIEYKDKNSKAFIDSTGEIVTRKFELLKKVNKVKYKKDPEIRNSISNEDDIFKVQIKGFNNGPLWLGFDNDNNSYWYDITNETGKIKRTGKYIFHLFIYDINGKMLKYFQTIEGGDLNYCKSPEIDIYGNVYIMQTWYKEGIKIYKYPRDW